MIGIFALCKGDCVEMVFKKKVLVCRFGLFGGLPISDDRYLGRKKLFIQHGHKVLQISYHIFKINCFATISQGIVVSIPLGNFLEEYLHWFFFQYLEYHPLQSIAGANFSALTVGTRLELCCLRRISKVWLQNSEAHVIANF